LLLKSVAYHKDQTGQTERIVLDQINSSIGRTAQARKILSMLNGSASLDDDRVALLGEVSDILTVDPHPPIAQSLNHVLTLTPAESSTQTTFELAFTRALSEKNGAALRKITETPGNRCFLKMATLYLSP